jgi:hypothetical protein
VSYWCRHTAPGGWAEFQDYDSKLYSEDGSLKDDSPLRKWSDILLDGCCRMGKDPGPGPKLNGWMEEAGFENIKHEVFNLPIGAWPKDKMLVCVVSISIST